MRQHLMLGVAACALLLAAPALAAETPAATPATPEAAADDNAVDAIVVLG